MMALSIAIAILGFGITSLSAVIAYLTWQNGKWVKETINRQSEMLYKQSEILNKQTEMLYKQNEILNKQTEMLYKQTEILNKHGEMLLEIKNAILYMEENAQKRHLEIVKILAERKI